jgi:hypothetical protein
VIGVRHPSLHTLAWRLLVTGLCLQLLLSSHRLIGFGWPYEAPLYGPFPFKVHPGTYLIALSLVCVLCSRGNPLGSALRAARAHPLLAAYAGAMVAGLLWLLARHGTSGAAFMVDTHWSPALVAFALMHFEDERRASLLRLLGVFIAINALVALGEYATAQRLTPLYMEGQAEGFAAEQHFRSSALLGHPLVNSQLTATLLPVALLLTLRAHWRWLHVGLLLLALLAFGGRTGLALVIVVYGIWAALKLADDAVHGRFSYLQLTGGSLLLTAAAAVLLGFVWVSGIGQRIFATLHLDNSAQVRLLAWNAFQHLDAVQLWLGTSSQEINAIALKMGLDPVYEAIENGWIVLAMQFGLVFFAVWLAGFSSLMWWMCRQAPPLVLAGIVVYMVNASTTNAFASKNITQGVLLVYVVAAAAHVRVRERSVQRAAKAARDDSRYARSGRSLISGPRP